jgi:transcriptional regulatory protein RtcR
MKRVVIGLLGTQLDRGTTEERWEKWRPSVSLCQHEDLVVDRFELLHEADSARLAEGVAADIRQVSPETEVRRHEIRFGRDPWDLADVYGALHDWAKGYAFDRSKEEYLVHITTGTHIAQITLFLLTEAGFLPGRLIQTSPPRGGKRVSSNGPGRYAVIDLDLSRYDALHARFAQDTADVSGFLKSGIATRSEAFNRLIGRIEQVALRSRAPILLTGPTGAGKSQLARRIYELRHQRGGLDGAMVEVNCATMRGDTAASALFGHVRGSFTGAQKDRPGLLREAHKGLLFLDEIGELGLDEQAMLLRALEDKTFLPVGSDKPVKSDFQLIAGTNRDLLKAVAEGRFREDLLARIQLWTFELPALRERREDLAPNLEYELRRFAETEGRQISLNKEARAAFLTFAEAPDTPWHGNFRDFNAAIVRMGTLAPRGRIRREDVEEEIARLRAGWRRETPAAGGGKVLLEILGEARCEDLDEFDRVQLAHVLAVCRECKTLAEAGRRLFAASRKKRAALNDTDRLKKYLAKWGLAFADTAGG